MRITLENMKHFKAVADWGNLNLAASKVNISPSAMSRSIKIIEEDLGYNIFQRTGRNIEINQDGRRFLSKVNHILLSYTNLYEENENNELSGSIRIGASHWLASKFVPQKLENILTDYPQVNFEIFSQDSNISILKVLSGDLDFAICFSPKDHEDIESTTLYEGQLLLAANNNHELINSTKPLNRIFNYPAIIHKANEFVFSCIDHPMFKEFDIKPDIKHYWDSDFTAIEFMKNKKYWTMMPDIIIQTESSLQSFKHPKKWNAPFLIKLIWNKKSNIKAINILKDYFV